MRRLDVSTSNYKQIVALATALGELEGDVPAMGLVYSEPGLGKTFTAIKLADRKQANYLRAEATMSARVLLETWAKELKLHPRFRSADLVAQVKSAMWEEPRLTIIDEIDHLSRDVRAIETIRDITDQTGAPVLMIGMENSVTALARRPHFFDRMRAHVIKCKPLAREESDEAITKLCEVDLDEKAKAELHTRSGGNFRHLIINIYRAERIARANGIKTITVNHLRMAA